ncbi:hypothetical protein ACLBWZ_16785 [Brucellaceae bacterium C25G]
MKLVSNRVRFTYEMQLAVRMKLALPLLLFGMDTARYAIPEFVHVYNVKTARIWAEIRVF